MSNTLATTNGDNANALELALVENDLSKLSVEGRLGYYKKVCESVGLNPLTKPFSYIRLNGQLQLYARKDCTDQLRKIHKVSLKLHPPKFEAGLVIVLCEATDSHGRTDSDIGVVSAGKLQGDNLANALMKANTKAKRRCTLSLCGLGWLDESEVETIAGAELVADPQDGQQHLALEQTTQVAETQVEPTQDEKEKAAFKAWCDRFNSAAETSVAQVEKVWTLVLRHVPDGHMMQRELGDVYKVCRETALEREQAGADKVKEAAASKAKAARERKANEEAEQAAANESAPDMGPPLEDSNGQQVL